jgi:hypothetical protein
VGVLLLNQPSIDVAQDALWSTINGTNYLLPGSLREAEWDEAGRKWATTAQMKRLMALYPNPPKVIFISNNEQQRLDWGNFWGDPRVLARDPSCKAAVDATGGDLSENGPGRNCLRRLFGDHWKRLYGRMLAGFRDGMRGTSWEPVMQLVGYDAFGPLNVGRGSNWMDFSLTVMGQNGTVERWDPWSEIWDGGIVSLYTHDFLPFLNDFTRSGPQAESMNLVPQISDVQRRKPNFWFEAGIWDGWSPGRWFNNDKRKLILRNGQTPSPDRYAGWVRYVMWITRAPVIREFRGYNDTNAETDGHFKALIEATEQVWNDADLAQFWREGELVRNDAIDHPYNQWHQPDGVIRIPRNYFIDTPSHRPYAAKPWGEYDQLNGWVYPVFAMALKRGGDYLVYAHAPTGALTGVQMQAPGQFSITADVPISGRFYLVRNNSIVRTIDTPRRAGDLVFTSLRYDDKLSPGAIGIAWGMKGKADRMTFTPFYRVHTEAAPIDVGILWSGDTGQTNFVVPKRNVPYTFGGWVRGYRGNERVGEGWITLGMASPILLTSGPTVPAGFVYTTRGNKQSSAAITAGPVKLSPGAVTTLVLYAVGTERMPMRIEGTEGNSPNGEVCYENAAPTRVRIGDWVRVPEYHGNVGPGYEQINLNLTGENGTPLPGLPRGANLPITVEHTDCFDTVQRSNVGLITIVDGP